MVAVEELCFPIMTVFVKKNDIDNSDEMLEILQNSLKQIAKLFAKKH